MANHSSYNLFYGSLVENATVLGITSEDINVSFSNGILRPGAGRGGQGNNLALYGYTGNIQIANLPSESFEVLLVITQMWINKNNDNWQNYTFEFPNINAAEDVGNSTMTVDIKMPFIDAIYADVSDDGLYTINGETYDLTQPELFVAESFTVTIEGE